MPAICDHCHAINAKSLCGRCKSTFYCNVKCQRAAWKHHKHKCNLPIIPTIPIINTQIKEQLSCYSITDVNKLKNVFDDSKSYSVIDLQFAPSNKMFQQLTKILVSPLTFWFLESLHMEFYTDVSISNIKIDDLIITHLFYVISKLPHLKYFKLDDIAPRNFISVQLKKKYFKSFKPNHYNSLINLFIPVDDVFHTNFNYKSFLSFVETSQNIRNIDLKLVYWVAQSSRSNIKHYYLAVNRIFTSILKRVSNFASGSRSIDGFSFRIEDIDESIDVIDRDFGNDLLQYFQILIATQTDLNKLVLHQRPFSKTIENQLWRFVQEKNCNLLHLGINDDRKLVPNAKSLYNCDDIINMISKQKYIEFIEFDGYILWNSVRLKNFVHTITNHCKQLKFIRFGWIEIQSQNDWKILMEILKCNCNISLLYFTPYQMNDDVINDIGNIQNIICGAVIENIKIFNEYMTKIEIILNSHFNDNEQKAVIHEIFKYLDDDEIKSNQLIIGMPCLGVMNQSTRKRLSKIASQIEKHVNQQIAVIKHISFTKTFQFKIY